MRIRDEKSLRRRGPVRAPYDYVLIVCEGSKTEPNYLRAMIKALRLSSANVVVSGDGGSAPQTVVADAIRLFGQDPNYDRVYCVFDKDGHPRYLNALQQIEQKSLTRRQGKTVLGKAEFHAITSVPCFEYWLLLHFTYTDAELRRYADVLPRLRSFPGFKDYDKGATAVYAVTKDRLPAAMANAERANAAAKADGRDNPTTRMPELVTYLQALADQRK